MKARTALTWLLALGFGVAYTQLPLFSANQHTKFLHGLAAAGVGSLDRDWIASTADPLPAFSLLVRVTHETGGDRLFYALYLVMLGIYQVTLAKIAAQAFGIDRRRETWLVFLAAFFAIHSAVPRHAALQILHFNLVWHLQSGVADQYLLGVVFQPCNFGVLLLVAVWLFLRGRDVAAVLLAAVAASFHPAYLISSGSMTLVILFVRWREGASLVRLATIATVSLAAVTPVLVHDTLLLGPTSPETWNEARRIITEVRIPWHTDPRVFLNPSAALKLTIMAGAAFVLRRDRQLGPMIAIPLAIGVAATIYRVVADDATVGFLSPWRMSAFLMPLSTTVLLGRGLAPLDGWVDRSSAGARQALALAACAVVALCVLSGARAQRRLFADREGHEAAPMLRWVALHQRPEDLYLVHPGMKQFRLETGAPTLASFKTHPYRDFEVLEWYQRLELAEAYFTRPKEDPCALLAAAVERFGVTHVVVTDGRPEACGPVAKEYDDGNYRVYRLSAAHLLGR